MRNREKEIDIRVGGYHLFVNGKQIFDRPNIPYEKWVDFVRSKGIEVSESGEYEGNINDFTDAIQIMESIVKEIEEKEKEMMSTFGGGYTSIFDFSGLGNSDCLLASLISVVNNSVAFMSFRFFLACKDQLEEDKTSPYGYRLKKGKKIKIKAYWE